MAYFKDCLQKFGYGNFAIRWLELMFATLVLVFGGILPLMKIGSTQFDAALPYDGLYNDPGATRYTVFAGAFATATALYVIITALIKFLHHGWHYWFVLILDILNWIFLLCSFAALSAALTTGYQGLRFCRSIGSILNTYTNSTPRPLQSLVSYLQSIQLACDFTYAGIAFGATAWLLWTFSCYQTGRMIFMESDAEDGTVNGQTGDIEERKSSEVRAETVTETPV